MKVKKFSILNLEVIFLNFLLICNIMHTNSAILFVCREIVCMCVCVCAAKNIQCILINYIDIHILSRRKATL